MSNRMDKIRLDNLMVQLGLVISRSQAESYIKLGKVLVNGKIITKPGYFVLESDEIKLTQSEQYVSRAALKLASVANSLRLDFNDKVVLDVGSSTGGFTDYALRHGAKKVIDVEIGKDQLHESLRSKPKIELHEQTDILNVLPFGSKDSAGKIALSSPVDMVVIDVSFVSLRSILPHIKNLCSKNTFVVAMLKPQFEAGDKYKHKGVIKNNKIRREIIKEFEAWLKDHFMILDKADSGVSGAKGNQERFYLLKATR